MYRLPGLRTSRNRLSPNRCQDRLTQDARKQFGRECHRPTDADRVVADKPLAY